MGGGRDKIGNLTGPGLDSGIYLGTKWIDILGSATTSRLGITSKPDFDFTNLGLLFPQDDPSEKIYRIEQIHHFKKLNSEVHLNVHFIQTEVTLPIFKADYRYYNNGETPPSFTTIDTSLESPKFTYPGSGSIVQILEFAPIPAVANETLSAVLEVIFYRDDNIITGDVLVKSIDIHIEKDAAGSRLEYIKF